jgi:hypothetical protein
MTSFKDLFPAYYQLSTADVRELWEEAIFFLDASYLLAFYEFPDGVREDSFRLLESVNERVRVPYMAALEFQRNRLKVIKRQKDHFEKVRSELRRAKEKALGDSRALLKDGGGLFQGARFNTLEEVQKQHPTINAEGFREGLEELGARLKKEVATFEEELKGQFEEFERRLDTLEEEQPDLDDRDEIERRLSELLADCVMAEHAKDFLESAYEEGKTRFSSEIAPGYKDQGKANEPGQCFQHNGRTYDRVYSDFVIWKEILEAVEKEKPQAAIFVTKDGKEDWIRVVRGRHTVGPKVELIQEVKARGAKGFHIQTPQGFVTTWADAEEGKDVSESTSTWAEETEAGALRRRVAEVLEAAGLSKGLKDYLNGPQDQRGGVEDEIEDFLRSRELVTNVRRNGQHDWTIEAESEGETFQIPARVIVMSPSLGDLMRIPVTHARLVEEAESWTEVRLVIVAVDGSGPFAEGIARGMAQEFHGVENLNVMVLGYRKRPGGGAELAEFTE